MRGPALFALLLVVLAIGGAASRCDYEPVPQVPAAASTPTQPASAAVFAAPASLERVPAPSGDAGELDAAGVANGTGTLVVKATHARDGSWAAGVNLRLDLPSPVAATPPKAGPRMYRKVDGQVIDQETTPVPVCVGRARVGADGVARFDAVPAGDYVLRNDRLDLDRAVSVRAGATCLLDYVVQPGMRLAGIVCDPEGTPIAGASIELLDGGDTACLDQVATADGAGRFLVLDVHVRCTLVARAEGYRAAAIEAGKVQDPKQLRLVLAPDGGAVWGSVEDDQGRLLADAVVQIGSAQTIGASQLRVRTDRRGHFHVFGLTTGEHAWSATAGGLRAKGACMTGGFLRVVVRVDTSPPVEPPTGSLSSPFHPERR